MNTRTRSLVVLITGFVLLGMPGSALSVAWPEMADDFGRTLGDLGILVLVVGIAYAAASFSIGRLSALVSAGSLLVVAALAGAVSLTAYALTDTWMVLVLASIPLGLSGGLIDSVGNGFVAVNAGPRAMGFIHAAFGLGAMVAPLLITALAAVGLSWRVGFAGLAAAEVAIAVAYLSVAASIRLPMEGERRQPVREGSRSLLGLSVWVFFIYAGVEGSTGFWAYTLLTEGQGVSATLAGVAVAAHWGALFASRLLLGFAGDRVEPNLTVGVSSIGIVIGLALLWWNPSVIVSIAGLLVAGFASGPIFPLEVLLTPGRFGTEFTAHAVGYQLSAATASIAVTPAVIGILVNQRGPLVIGAALTVLAVVMAISVEALRLVSAREGAPASEPVT
ncbi:MAG: MFS transporter [Acidimicrobiia bacterium]|nr:MFS transporter [Acidimicrobiia bacterium]